MKIKEWRILNGHAVMFLILNHVFNLVLLCSESRMRLPLE